MRKLNFTLDYKSFEIIYISFILPMQGYDNIVWCNCTQYEKDEIELCTAQQR